MEDESKDMGKERMNKTSWIITISGILAMYCFGFAINSELWVHLAFALSLALSIVTLSQV